MKRRVLLFAFVCSLAISATATVNVSSPSSGAVVGSPVHYAATASTTTCSKGVASMGIYVNNTLTYVVNGTNLNTSISLGTGAYNTVVEEWDYCGGATFTKVPITVSGGGSTGGGNSLYNLQAASWTGWGEYPPAYNICSSCGSGVTWYMGHGVKSPSLSGNATQYTIGGTHPYSDVLFVNKTLGQGSPIPDSSHKILPNLHNFTYDVYFWGGNLSVSQVLEFDISMYFNGLSFIWGNQCRIAGGHAWDIWDNIHSSWVAANVSCYPISNGWNHLTIQAQRTSNNQLLFHSITLNGNTAVINRYYSPASAPSSWYGLTLNFQMDGNYKQSPYTVYLDKLTFNYW